MSDIPNSSSLPSAPGAAPASDASLPAVAETASSIAARSRAIPRTWATFDWPSMFSAVLYPALGVLVLTGALVIGLALESVRLHWWYGVLALGVGAVTLFVCNQGIGPLHRVWQHRAGELAAPAQVIVALNCIIAMQGRLTDWLNYHAQHHRLADRPGDPHNPSEGVLWAWVGWLLWRDRTDLERPTPRWFAKSPVLMFFDRNLMWLSLLVHLIAPLTVYVIVGLMGGSLVLTAILHASAVLARALQFHATTLGVNVFGHLDMPAWFTYALALLTGGEAFHAHHHDEPRSALHLPKNGLINRIFDYNGTMLLLMRRAGLARDLLIAPQFLPAPQAASASQSPRRP